MTEVLARWCDKFVHHDDARERIVSALRASIERDERFSALIGRGLTTNSYAYVLNRFAGHVFINVLEDDLASAYDLQGPRLRCGSFPAVHGFTRSNDVSLFAIERFEATATRTGTTARRIACRLKWNSAGIVLGGGMGVHFTSNYGGDDADLIIPLSGSFPTGDMTINLDLEGLELVDRGVCLCAELIQLGGFGLLPNVVSAPVLQILCV